VTCIEIRGKRKITLLPFVVTTDKFLDCNRAINFKDVPYGTCSVELVLNTGKQLSFTTVKIADIFCPFPSVLQNLSPNNKRNISALI